MKIQKSILLFTILIGLSISSCVTRKNLTYLQYSDSQINDTRLVGTPADYKIMPFDNLFIRVITPDPLWSDIFNPSTGAGSMTQESAGLFGYPVDIDGNIEIPFVGKVDVEGKTLSEIKATLDTVFKDYLRDASITVRIVNNYVSIIGEVGAPGRYPLSKDRINIFEALSMAGDLGDYSQRQKIQVIRNSQYGPVVKEFSLTDRNILTSELYYILPNDIIYAQPMKMRTFQMNAATYSVVLGSITTLLTIIVFFRPG